MPPSLAYGGSSHDRSSICIPHLVGDLVENKPVDPLVLLGIIELRIELLELAFHFFTRLLGHDYLLRLPIGSFKALHLFR